MRLVVLGSAGSFTNDERHTACYMIPELGIVFDCGNGVFRAPKYVETETVYIFLSHAHLDHIEGIRMCKYIRGENCKNLIVYALPEVIEAIRSLYKQPITGDGITIDFELRTINPNETLKLENGAEIKTFPLFHTSKVLGYRVNYQGKSICYVTDTRSTETETYAKEIDNADLLLQEIYYPNSLLEKAYNGGHSVPKTAAKVIKDAHVKNVYVIHHNPSGGMDTIIKELQEEVPTAKQALDNMVIEI